MNRGCLKRIGKINQNGQAVFGEYVLVIFLVAGVLAAMGVFFQRAFQGRIRDTHKTMAETVLGTIGGGGLASMRPVIRGGQEPGESPIEDIIQVDSSSDYTTSYYSQYEPYYVVSDSDIYHKDEGTTELIPIHGTTTGIFKKEFYEENRRITTSETLPPKDADDAPEEGGIPLPGGRLPGGVGLP